jgi:hypothetical protein
MLTLCSFAAGGAAAAQSSAQATTVSGAIRKVGPRKVKRIVFGSPLLIQTPPGGRR